jgi:nitroimidazol reductase NimA-like FMN-containing flavoprotein (pyridoxamine 5'-phosphate oxidase superfamily)
MTGKRLAPPTDRTRVRRIAAQACYDPNTVHAIVDEAYLCHIAFQDEKGTHCIPMACWRLADHLYIHGSNGSRLIKQLASGVQVAVSITHLDGLVFARSAFNHSMNYRSAVIYGKFERIVGEAAKRLSLDMFMEKLAPGRNAEIRQGSSKELGSTTVMRISLEEAATKIRAGGPIDDEEDMNIPVWAGVLPLAVTRLSPQPHSAAEIEMPAYVSEGCPTEKP